MPRLKLQPHECYPYCTELTLRVTDINYGGHLGNDAVMGLLHQSRIEVLTGMGFSEMDLGDGCTGLVQTDCAIVYQGEGFLMDRVVVESVFTEIRGSTFRICSRITRNNQTLVLAEAGFVGFDYEVRKTVQLPEEFRKAVIGN